ncbi:unnamed protein product [Coffea canephora]|uniref:C3H1-type domain-containing protein n=1 Tax=Coffea canephora TaxID=49390 RepID=A0A068U057_COFCA|nr:unnamed protein product [Coffea canephora]
MYITVLFTYLSDPIHSSPRLLLVQAKFFQSEDCLSEVGREPPGNPHEKVSNENIAIADGFPGSSVGSYPNPLSHKGVSHIPQIPWRTPPRQFDLKFECHVAAGEESEEVEVQKHREMRVHEAVYPHFSAVPHCPSISSDVEAEHFDDWHTPVIPVTAIEEAAETDCLAKPEPAKLPQSPSTSEIFDIPQCKSLLSRELSKGKKSDHAPLQDLDGPMVAAAAATTAIMKSKEPPSLIDPELLIKLLSNPELVQKLIAERRLASDTTTRTSGSKTVDSTIVSLVQKSTTENTHPGNAGIEAVLRPGNQPLAVKAETGTGLGPKQVTTSISLLSSKSDLPSQNSNYEVFQRADVGNMSLLKASRALSSSIPDVLTEVYRLKKLIEEHGSHDRAGNDYVGEIPAPSSIFLTISCCAFSCSLTTTSLSLQKDISYFQSLIRQHGEEKGSQDDELSLYGISHNHLQSKESDRKYKRTCKFYNSSMGCRNGSSCPYEHDVPGQWRSDVVLEAPGAKRLKLGGSFTGRT